MTIVQTATSSQHLLDCRLHYMHKKRAKNLAYTKSSALLRGPPGARTPHTLIKSQVLYQMS